jgi:hypothetical protein
MRADERFLTFAVSLALDLVRDRTTILAGERNSVNDADFVVPFLIGLAKSR